MIIIRAGVARAPDMYPRLQMVKYVRQASVPQVPVGFGAGEEESQEVLEHLRWMLQVTNPPEPLLLRRVLKYTR